MDKLPRNDALAKFKETWHRVDKLFNAYAKSKGINFATLIILEFLYDEGGTYTQKDLCEKLALPKQFVNSIMKSLWEQGYVELKEAKDRRNKKIILTQNGRLYAGEILRCLQDAENMAWESFSDDEVIAFFGAMEKYEKSFERILKNQESNTQPL